MRFSESRCASFMSWLWSRVVIDDNFPSSFPFAFLLSCFIDCTIVYWKTNTVRIEYEGKTIETQREKNHNPFQLRNLLICLIAHPFAQALQTVIKFNETLKRREKWEILLTFIRELQNRVQSSLFSSRTAKKPFSISSGLTIRPVENARRAKAISSV